MKYKLHGWDYTIKTGKNKKKLIVLRKVISGQDIAGEGSDWWDGKFRVYKHNANVLIIVDEDGNVQLSANGTIAMDSYGLADMNAAISAAQILLKEGDSNG